MRKSIPASLLLLFVSGLAEARPSTRDWIRIGGEPVDERDPLSIPTLVFTPDDPTDSSELARSFVEYTDPLARLRDRRARARKDEAARAARNSSAKERDSAIIIRWLTETIDFVRSFAGGRESWINKDFEASYLQRMKWSWTEKKGWFWVIRVSQSSIWTEYLRIDRRSGSAGFQLPILGSQSIELRSGQGQLLLRLLPLAGTYRRNYSRDPDGVIYKRTDGTSGLEAVEITPGAELDGSVHWAGNLSRVTTGARVLTQNWVTDDRLFRFIAEVYLRFDLSVHSRWVKKMSLVPRCIFEHYSEGVEADWGPEVRGSLEDGQTVTRCFMTLELRVDP